MSRILVVTALALLSAACLDFDQYSEGPAGAGGIGGGIPGGGSPGGGGSGGEGAGPPSCPTDVPANICLFADPFDFDFDLETDGIWDKTGPGQVGTGCSGECLRLGLGTSASRVDYRSVAEGVVSDCFASVRVVGTDGRASLELVPDVDGSGFDDADVGRRVEVSISGSRVGFVDSGTALGSVDVTEQVDALRIQVRSDGVALEALSQGAVVACSLIDTPAVLQEDVRVGLALTGSPNAEAELDEYGAAL